MLETKPTLYFMLAQDFQKEAALPGPYSNDFNQMRFILCPNSSDTGFLKTIQSATGQIPFVLSLGEDFNLNYRFVIVKAEQFSLFLDAFNCVNLRTFDEADQYVASEAPRFNPGALLVGGKPHILRRLNL